MEDSPYSPPSSEVTDTESLRDYSGMDRGEYFGAILVLWVVNAVLIGVFGAQSATALVGSLILLIVSLRCLGSRLHNVGVSGWWALLLLVPLVNLAVMVAALALPRAFRDTRTLDTRAKALFGVMGLVILVIAIAVVK